MRRLLSDPLPLRTTADLGDFAEVRTLPLVYGRTTISPVPMDMTGLRWLLADHRVVGVDRVTVGGVQTAGWQLAQEVGPTGTPLAFLLLSQPPRDGAPLAVTLVGKPDPITGSAIDHPADIVHDLVGLQPGGWEIPDLERLRDDYPGLRLGGMVADAVSLRDAVDQVLSPIGALWSPSPWRALRDTPDNATLLALDTPRAECRHDDLVTTLQVTFGYDYAAGRPAGAFRATAPVAVERYGRIERALDLRWVPSARDATQIARRYLEQRARVLWRITGTAPMRGDLPAPGDSVTVDHALMPPGAGLVHEVTGRRDRAEVDVSVSVRVGSLPAITIDRYSSALEPVQPEGIQVEYRDGVATITVVDDLGRVLAGALVTLNGAETRTTDRNGRAQFQVERGTHTLLVVAAGFEPYEIEVIL